MKLSEDERAGLETLKAKMPEELAMEVVKFRRQKKAPITPRIARALLREYETYGNIEEAVDKHLVRGWVGFEAAWVKKAQGFTDQNHPTPRPSVNYGNPAPANDAPPAKKAIDPERRAQIVALALRSVRRA